MPIGRRPLIAFAMAALSLGAAVTAVSAGAAGAAPRLLDVPYLSQTEDLCGGAALAMVLRYWGEREVHAEDFAPLVDRGNSGIHTDVLAEEVTRRGWQSFPVNMAAATGAQEIRDHVERGRPVIALIEVGPGRYHYVVIVAWTAGDVIAHDPARQPFRMMSQGDFARAWGAAGRWALVILPPAAPSTPPVSPPLTTTLAPVPRADVCDPFIHDLVAAARNGDLTAAETGLLSATTLCPDNPAAWRELAGVRFLQSRWADASELAAHAARLDPGDRSGWELLATSRFLNGEPNAALDAWNQIALPSVDIVRIEGVRHTRHPVVSELIDLPPRTVLTAAHFSRAARRLDDLPSSDATRLRYRPLNGVAEIEAVIVERPIVPSGIVPLATIAARSWVRREFKVDVASPTGSGELWTAAWRWWENRPRVGVGVAVPSALGLHGVAAIDASWERQSYAFARTSPTGAPTIARDARRRVMMSLSDWRTSRLRWTAGAGVDRWEDEGHVAVDGGIDLRLVADRVSVRMLTGAWAPVGSGDRFAKAEVAADWRSTRERNIPSWSLTAGFAAATVRAPFDLWPGAGTGDARSPLLRAHPLLTNGVVTGPVFGRRLAHASLEYQRPMLTTPLGSLAWAGFTDIAAAWGRMSADAGERLHTDVGAGIRMVVPGKGGVIRIDVARGLRDGEMAFSTGWQAPWP